jgi:Trp repressor protein
LNINKQITTNLLNFTNITMKALSPAERNHILSLLDSGHSGHEISSITGAGNATISRLRSRYRPYLNKSSGGRPSKLSTSNTVYAMPFVLLALGGLKMLWKSPESSRMSSTNLSQLKQFEMA